MVIFHLPSGRGKVRLPQPCCTHWPAPGAQLQHSNSRSAVLLDSDRSPHGFGSLPPRAAEQTPKSKQIKAIRHLWHKGGGMTCHSQQDKRTQTSRRKRGTAATDDPMPAHGAVPSRHGLVQPGLWHCSHSSERAHTSVTLLDLPGEQQEP